MSPPRVVHPDAYFPPGHRNIDPDPMGRRGGRARDELVLERGVCRACGCTDERACEGGCAWVDVDHTLCSTCAARALASRGAQVLGNEIGGLLRQAFGDVGGIISDALGGLLGRRVQPTRRKTQKRAKAVMAVRPPRRTPRRGPGGGQGG